MLQPVQLRLNRFVDSGIGMTEQVDPPGADGIEITPAVEVFQPHALAAANGDQRQLLMVFHLGAGMPQYGQVALNKLVVSHGVHMVNTQRHELRKNWVKSIACHIV